MNSFIQVDKNEWKAILAELGEFKNEWKVILAELDELEKKYELLLNELNMAQGRLQAQDEKEKRELEQIMEASQQRPEETSREQAAAEVKENFLTRFKTRLESLTVGAPRSQVLKFTQYYASCSNCGHWIVGPARFCQRCGADFGGLVCTCGRQLASGDRFCDRCGRKV